jgi:hypothetical protein
MKARASSSEGAGSARAINRDFFSSYSADAARRIVL